MENLEIETIGFKDASVWQFVIADVLYEAVIEWDSRTITVYCFENKIGYMTDEDYPKKD